MRTFENVLHVTQASEHRTCSRFEFLRAQLRRPARASKSRDASRWFKRWPPHLIFRWMTAVIGRHLLEKGHTTRIAEYRHRGSSFDSPGTSGQ